MEVHSLHRRARVHARPSVAAVDVAARRDAALTHTATEGRLPERLEPPVPSGGELHVQDAAWEEKEGHVQDVSRSLNASFILSFYYFIFCFRVKIKDAADGGRDLPERVMRKEKHLNQTRAALYLLERLFNLSPDAAGAPTRAAPCADPFLRHHICLLLS